MLRAATIENAGLVEMDVRLDEARDDQTAVERVPVPRRSQCAIRWRRSGRPAMPISSSASPCPAMRAWRRMRSSDIAPVHATAPPRHGRDTRLPAPDPAPDAVALSGAHDLAGFEHIAAVGNRQRQRRHLIDQQDRDALVAQFGEHVEQLVDHRRRKPQRRLVEQQNARLRHQPARNGQHLLLAAGKQPGAARTGARAGAESGPAALRSRLDGRRRLAR